MTPVSTILVTPSSAVMDGHPPSGVKSAPGAGGSFASTMREVLNAAEQTGLQADAQAMKAISGEANLTDVVTALSHAELTLQTVTAIRDRFIQAYQDVMKMPI
jgi:flagellar hook-basal body complex protein FliE